MAYNRGVTLEKMNRAADARASFVEALALDPKMARAHTAIGLSYALQGDSVKAKAEYETALTMLAREKTVDDEIAARHNLALLLFPKDPKTAIDLWERNLTLTEDMPSLIGIAHAYTQVGRTADAIAAYRRMLDLRPGYLGARLALAQTLVNAGFMDDAVAALEPARAANSDNPEVWEILGDATVRDPRRSKAAYETALSLSADKQQRSRIRLKLQKLP